MTRFYIDTDSDEPCPFALREPTDELTYFLSFAVAERYGAQHDLAKAANLIKIRHRVDMNPLLNFVDRRVETAQDRAAFERGAWQDPEPLAGCIQRVLSLLGSDEKIAAYLAEYPLVAPRLEDIFEVCLWAMEHGARVRLSFDLEAESLKTPLVVGDDSPAPQDDESA